MRRPAELRTTFIVAVVAFGGVMSLTFAAFSSYFVAHNLREQFERRGERLTENLASEAVDFLTIADPAERTLSLALLTHRATIGDVAYAQVVVDGNVISESVQPGHTVLELGPDVASVPVSRETAGDTGTYLEFTRPFPNDSRPSYIRLGMSLESVDQRVQRTILFSGGLSLLFTFVGAVVAFGLYSVTLKPLEHLVHSIRRLSTGEVHVRAQMHGYRELEEISSAFDSMAAEIKRRTEALRERNADLQEANRAKSEFLSMMGHELKAPLHSILGYCQVLLEELDGPLSDDQKDDVGAVLAAGHHLLSVIQNILRFSDSGTERLHVTAVPLAALLEQAARSVRPMADRKSLTVTVDADATETVCGDETKLKQVLINLMHNAVKYTDHGEVHLQTHGDRDTVRVTIRDTGAGIPESEHDAIFEPFTRIDRGEGREMQGLGLGLAVVRRYVAAHGGTVHLESHEGRGSRFEVCLPRSGPPDVSGPPTCPHDPSHLRRSHPDEQLAHPHRGR